MYRSVAVVCTCLPVLLTSAAHATAGRKCWPGFVPSALFNEQVREIRFASEVRAIIIAPSAEQFQDERPTQLVIYATPNGNTIEQTLGCRAEGRDWHFDIQHVAAQVRRWREIRSSDNVVLACVQADMLSWPAWRRKYFHSSWLIRQFVSALTAQVPTDGVRLVLTGHSGGGSFITGFIDATDEIPPEVVRIAYLDANYSYSNDNHHGKKFLQWLRANLENHLIVLAYDDRDIELNGNKVVGPTGGTYRASQRMLDYLRDEIPLYSSRQGDFDRYTGVDGRLRTLIHPNPDNRILHTRLVGEMNGLLYALTAGTPMERPWGQLGAPRAYRDWVQPTPFEPEHWVPTVVAIPPRKISALTGSEFAARLLEASTDARESTIVAELLNGNLPSFLHQFVDIRASMSDRDGSVHEIVYRVMPDYLSIGTDDDFVRVPVTPATAQFLADAYGCMLPTRKMVNDVHRTATLKLAPQPLTEDREAFATFVQHHQLIEQQRKEQGDTAGNLITGIKKDVVVSSAVHARPGHVAIYGWHDPDGRPIQPLTTVHTQRYVDYSHGVRLVAAIAQLDGLPVRLTNILANKQLHSLLSDEGPIEDPRYRPAASVPE